MHPCCTEKISGCIDILRIFHFALFFAHRNSTFTQSLVTFICQSRYLHDYLIYFNANVRILFVCLTCYITVFMSLFLLWSSYLRNKSLGVYCTHYFVILMMGPENCKRKCKPVHQSINNSAYSVLKFLSLVAYQLIVASYLMAVQIGR